MNEQQLAIDWVNGNIGQVRKVLTNPKLSRMQAISLSVRTLDKLELQQGRTMRDAFADWLDLQ